MNPSQMTTEELQTVASSPEWKVGFWEKKYAKDELDRRLVASTRRGVGVGDTIEFVRYGSVPDDGTSFNHRDGCKEEGVSVYLLSGGEVVYVGWWFGITDRPAYRGKGVVVGFGSDGEPLVRVLKVRRSRKFDLK